MGLHTEVQKWVREKVIFSFPVSHYIHARRPLIVSTYSRIEGKGYTGSYEKDIYTLYVRNDIVPVSRENPVTHLSLLTFFYVSCCCGEFFVFFSTGNKLAMTIVDDEGVTCLRDATLEVIPEVVQRGHEAILRCHYVSEDMPIYAVKWYRGKHEFYRFTPKAVPSTKNFPVSGIQIIVSFFSIIFTVRL